MRPGKDPGYWSHDPWFEVTVQAHLRSHDGSQRANDQQGPEHRPGHGGPEGRLVVLGVRDDVGRLAKVLQQDAGVRHAAEAYLHKGAGFWGWDGRQMTFKLHYTASGCPAPQLLVLLTPLTAAFGCFKQTASFNMVDS